MSTRRVATARSKSKGWAGKKQKGAPEISLASIWGAWASDWEFVYIWVGWQRKN